MNTYIVGRAKDGLSITHEADTMAVAGVQHIEPVGSLVLSRGGETVAIYAPSAWLWCVMRDDAVTAEDYLTKPQWGPYEPKTLLRRTLDKISEIEEARQEAGELPQEWDQGSWRVIYPLDTGEGDRCKTAMCFAGWAAELSPEVEWVVSEKDILGRNLSETTLFRRLMLSEYVWCTDELALRYPQLSTRAIPLDMEDGTTRRAVEARLWAQLALGLSEDEAATLFASSNDLATIRKFIELVEAGVRDDALYEALGEWKQAGRP